MPVDKLDRYRGCLLGGAAGDALGYPVEFLSLDGIREQYGPAGITEYKLQRGVAQISDGHPDDPLYRQRPAVQRDPPAALRAGRRPRDVRNGWVLPGVAEDPAGALPPECRVALRLADERSGSVPTTGPGLHLHGGHCPGGPGHAGGPHQREQEGCGGIMRVAPAGLWLDCPEKACQLATELAAMTHGHELGYLPAGVLGYCVSALAHGKADCVLDAVRRALKWTARQFPGCPAFPGADRPGGEGRPPVRGGPGGTPTSSGSWAKAGWRRRPWPSPSTAR